MSTELPWRARRNRKGKGHQHVFLTAVVESDSHPVSSLKGKAMEEAAPWQGVGLLQMQLVAPGLKSLSSPSPRRLSARQVFPLSSYKS